MFIVGALIILFIIWGLYYHLKNLRLYKMSWNVPGPLNLPFIGVGYRLIGAEVAAKFNNLFNEYPEVSKVWLLDELFYFISKPEYIQIILSSSKALEKPRIYDYSRPLLGDGLLTSKVNIWRKHRKLITPTFNQKILCQYPSIISNHCATLLDILEKFDGAKVDYCQYITNCTIDIVGEAFFGHELKTQASTVPYCHIIDQVMETCFMRCFNKIYGYDIVFDNSKYAKVSYENVAVIRELAKSVINREIEKQGHCVQNENQKIRPFLSIAVDAYFKKEWTMQELEDEVLTFLLAGSDTNASAVSFVLIMLAMHPEAQDKVYEEALNILGPTRLIELDDLPNLKYTERVIKETLRLFPAAPYTGRVLTDDIDIEDYIIPKHATVLIGYLSVHRSKTYWPNPLIFDPDRFLPENSINRHPYSWIPFSAGPRNCIGFTFGLMTTKIIVALITRKFKLSTPLKQVEDVKFSTNIVLKPEGIKLRFHPR